MSWLIPTAAILVSIIVAIVQYAQWRTANQKVVIDLYEKRLSLYSQIESAVHSVMSKGEATQEDLYQFAMAQTGARFLFGQDVRSYLQGLREHLAWLVTYTNQRIDESPQRQELIDEQYQRMTKFVAFLQQSPDIFAPYLRLDQKSTPFWRPW